MARNLHENFDMSFGTISAASIVNINHNDPNSILLGNGGVTSSTSLLSDLSNDGNAISISVGGATKKIVPAYANVSDIAGKALKDGSGNTITTTYLPLSGDATISGGLKTTLDSGQTYIYDNVASKYLGDGDATGTIVIDLPNGWSRRSMNIYEIELYEYDSNNQHHTKIIVSGYNFSGYGGSWYDYSTTIEGGSIDKPVRLGYNSATSKCCILIGTTVSTWSFTSVYLTKILSSIFSPNSWRTGYNISLITDESNIIKIVTPPISPKIAGGFIHSSYNSPNYLLTANGGATISTSLFTDLSNNGSNVSATIGGTSKTLIVNYAKTAGSAITASGANSLITPRTIGITGAVVGDGVSFNGTSNININASTINLNSATINGLLPLANLPQGALERLTIVTTDTARLALTIASVQNGDTVKVTATNKLYVVVDDTKLGTEAAFVEYSVGSALHANTADYATSTGYATNAHFTDIASYSTYAGTASYASYAGTAIYASNAASLGSLPSASYATKDAITSGTIIAKSAVNATTAVYALTASTAAFLGSLPSTSYATKDAITSGTIIAKSAVNATTAVYALTASTAAFLGSLPSTSYATIDAITLGTIIAKSAINATTAGTAIHSSSADNATNATSAKTAGYASSAGWASYASYSTQAQYATNAGWASNSNYATSALKDNNGNTISTYYSVIGHTHAYLPLSGGSMANTTVVTNLNADLLDGHDSTYFATSGHTHAYLPLSGGTLTGAITATSFVKTGGSATQLLLANGDVKATSDFAKSAHSHTISNITDFPTVVSAFTNDVGYLTKIDTYNYISNASITNDMINACNVIFFTPNGNMDLFTYSFTTSNTNSHFIVIVMPTTTSYTITLNLGYYNFDNIITSSNVAYRIDCIYDGGSTHKIYGAVENLTYN